MSRYTLEMLQLSMCVWKICLTLLILKIFNLLMSICSVQFKPKENWWKPVHKQCAHITSNQVVGSLLVPFKNVFTKQKKTDINIINYTLILILRSPRRLGRLESMGNLQFLVRDRSPSTWPRLWLPLAVQGREPLFRWQCRPGHLHGIPVQRYIFIYVYSNPLYFTLLSRFISCILTL